MSERPLVCTTCRQTVLVTEIPDNWIDPARYVCGQCLTPVPQPELQPQPHETPAYNPAQSQIPF